MADIKSLQQITTDAKTKDAPILTQIITDINTLIDGVMLLETEYTFTYDLTSALSTTVPLQAIRITNQILKSLKDQGYTANIDTNTNIITVTWLIAGLQQLPTA